MKRWLFVLAVIVVLLPVAAVLGGGAVLDSGLVRARLLDAVQRATGHAARIDGPIGIAWSLTPAIQVRQVTLLNEPGFSRPAFATVDRIEARLALLPLVTGRVDIRGVTLDGADVLLERDATGRGNWLPPPAPPPTEPAAPAAAPRARTPVEIAAVTITNAKLAWRDGPAATIASFTASPAGGPIAGALTLNGVPFTVKGQSGPIDRAPVPLDVSVVGGGLAMTLSGQAGAALAFQVLAPDLTAVAPLAGRPLPPLRDIRLSGQIGPTGLAALHLLASASDLGALSPGLKLVRLEMTAPAPDQPMKLTAEAALQALPIAVALNVDSLAALRGPARIPFQALILADGATFGAQGTVADLRGHAAEMTVSARIPDLRRTGALAGLALPPLRDAALDVRILPAPGGNGVLARGLRLMMAQGDLAGDLAVGFTPRPSLRGSLISQRLDLDGWLPAPVAAAPTPAPAPPPTAPVAPAPKPAPARLIPDRALPFAALRSADADLRLSIAQATLNGAAYRAIEARLLLQDGRLRADPLQMQSPGGAVQGQVLADAAATPPTAAVTLRAPGLDAAPIAAAFGAPGAVTGTVDLDLQLRGAGATMQTMAATLDGHLGAALVDGDVDNDTLAVLFGSVLRAANLPVEATGRSRVRCFAIRADAAAGRVTLPSLALDSTRARVEGEGTVSLADETLDLHLRPTIRLGPTSVEVPVRLLGPLRAPVPALEKGVIAPGRFGISIGGKTSDPCGPALTAARDGHAGAMPR